MCVTFETFLSDFKRPMKETRKNPPLERARFLQALEMLRVRLVFTQGGGLGWAAACPPPSLRGVPGGVRALSCPPASGCKRSEALGHHLKAGEQREATQEPPGSPSPPKASLQSAGARNEMYRRENSKASRSPRGESNRRKEENGALMHPDRDRPSEEALRRHLVAAVGTAALLKAEAWAGRPGVGAPGGGLRWQVGGR